jgi:hypothetical protein
VKLKLDKHIGGVKLLIKAGHTMVIGLILEGGRYVSRQ